MRTISLEKLERIFQVFHDIKKEIAYNKDTGFWYWYDQDEADNPEAWHNNFSTALRATMDAASPYLEHVE